MQLLPSLAQAHRALIQAQDSQHPHSVALGATARKIEASMLALLADTSPEDRTKLAFAILASGSLKALKTIPETPVFAQKRWGNDAIDMIFLMGQSGAYRAEAEKRGAKPGVGDVAKIVESVLTGAIDPKSPGIAQALQTKQPTVQALLHAVVRLFEKPSTTERRLDHQPPVHNPAAAAAFLAPILKRVARDSSAAPHLADALRNLCVIPRPEQAHEHALHMLVTFALMGLKKPENAAFENDEIQAFCTSIFSSEGHKQLTLDTKGLASWLAGGWANPPAIVANMVAKTQPVRRRGYW